MHALKQLMQSLTTSCKVKSQQQRLTFEKVNRILIKINNLANKVTKKLANKLTMQNLQNNKQFRKINIVYQQQFGF